jgi:hypothetical protein
MVPTTTSCADFTNGGTITIDRMQIITYIGDNTKSTPGPGGPIVLYYHGLLSGPAEVLQGFGQSNIDSVTAMGGVVLAFTSTACTNCRTTDAGAWFAEDDVIQDAAVACAIQKAHVDTRHIHALGYGEGGVHTMHVALARSNYIASVVSYAGGYLPFPNTNTVEDPKNHVAAILTYGPPEGGVIIDANSMSTAWYQTFQPLGYYAMMCYSSADMHAIDPAVAAHALRFFLDHPYEVAPEPYANAIPTTFPTYCANSPR